jgi:RNA-directed DNA polymerase
MLVIEPTKGRELTHWSQINWTGIEANVRRLQSRIYRAAANGEHAKVQNLHKLMVRSVSAQLLAIRQGTQDNSGKHTPGVDGGVCDTPQKRMAQNRMLVHQWCHHAHYQRHGYKAAGA